MSDELIGVAVLALRFLVPLLILRYPLPGIVGAIAADSLDGAILTGYTDLSLDNYQIYDKALDTFYLAIAYAAVLRNWTEPAAVAIGRFLWFYRLLGVTLFALTENRLLLFLFPATFEYFFISYEVVRVRWSSRRLTSGHVVAMAVAAWAVKLPQELWVHVSQGSTNEWVKQHVFGMDPATPRPEVLAANLWAIPAAMALLAALVAVARRVARRLPPRDHPTRFDADRYDIIETGPADGAPPAEAPQLSAGLVERIALVALVGIVFAELLPDVHANAVQVTIGLSFLVVVSSAMNVRLGDQGTRARSPAAGFIVICAINTPIVMTLALAARWTDASVGVISVLFYVLLTSLLIGLHDRYYPARSIGVR